jgi:hypothetical protein
VFKRITSRSLRGNSFDPELEIELIRNGFDYLLSVDDPEEHVPFSLMQVDEFLALLSFPGITWFVSNKVRLGSRQAALSFRQTLCIIESVAIRAFQNDLKDGRSL